MVGPDYRTPPLPAVPAFTNAPTDSRAAEGVALTTWWQAFGDSVLDDLVARAVRQNHDLRIATARVDEVRALRRIRTLDRWPAVQSTAGFTDGLAAAPVGTPRAARDYETYDIGFDAIWELDLFGRVRRSVQAANAEYEGAEASRLDVLVRLTAEVAREYLELRGRQAQLAVARKNAELQGATLKLTQTRAEGGRGNEFDVSRSRSLLNLTRAAIPPLEGEVRKTIHRLGVLTGQIPTALAAELAAAKPLPALPALTVESPAAVLRRRPDIRVAERRVAAESALTGVATADLFPRVMLLGGIGLQASTFSGLGDNGSDTWSLGPRLTWAAFDLGRVRARIRAGDARAEVALAAYERAVLGALEETENALLDFGTARERQWFLTASAAASQRAFELAHERYEAGSADFISVLDAERTLLEAQDRLAASETRAATVLVAIYKAFGGGVPAPPRTSTDGEP